MKKSASNFLIAFLFLGLFQLHSSVLKAQENKEAEANDLEDALPVFKGSYEQYLKENVKYPPEAEKNKIEGVVFAEVIIGKNGKIENVKIKKDIGCGCGEEVQRVLCEMPDWKPGKQNGRDVSVKMIMRVKFILPTNNAKDQKKKDNSDVEQEAKAAIKE